MNTAASAAILLPKAAVWARGAIRRDRANAYALAEPWTLPPLGGDLPRLGLMPPAPFGDSRIRVDLNGPSGAGFKWRSAPGLNGRDAACLNGPSAVITVLPWELDSRECDGCTLAPDSWGDLRLYVAALFHDRWYLSMDAIAARWGWPVKRVRRLGDIVFATLIRSLATGLPWASRQRARLAAWLYYRGVRAFGGVAHDIMKDTSSPGGGGGISPHSSTSLAPVALAGLLLFAAGCSGGCRLPNAWDDTVGFYRIEEPAVAFTNTVTGEHFEAAEYAEDTEDTGEGE